MHEEITRTLVGNEARLIYTTNKNVEKGLRSLQGEFRRFHYELCTNEKIAYELALVGSYTSKRTVCLITSEGIYEALDAIMSSAYTGTAGGFLVVCVQENDVLATPVGLFAKLPFIVADSIDAFRSAVEYGFKISEKYETPVIIQTTSIIDHRAMNLPGSSRIRIAGRRYRSSATSSIVH